MGKAKSFFKNICTTLILLGMGFGISNAQTAAPINLDASTINSVSTIFLSPSSQEVLEGSTFDVSVFLNTKKVSINTVELRINFDQSKLNIVRPSSGKSIIGVWVESPSYSNSNGTITLSGIIPNGIVTEGGLITTITFKAVATGRASISISPTSRILANNGLGSEVISEFGRGQYTILPRAPDGPEVFSDTHPFSGEWYNNNNISFGWIKTQDFTDFSYVLDTKPFTVPENTSMTQETGVSFQGVADGLWYFHLKGAKQGVWGKTTHFLVRIDTAPPARFSPELESLNTNDRVLISFFTTDYLSGIDHYEVGVIEKSKSANESPVFIQTESPYHLPLNAKGDLRVIVRAFDKAGNVSDETIEASGQQSFMGFIKRNLISIVLAILLVLVVILIILYLIRQQRRRRRLIASYEYPRPRRTLPANSYGSQIGSQEAYRDYPLVERRRPIEKGFIVANKKSESAVDEPSNDSADVVAQQPEIIKPQAPSVSEAPSATKVVQNEVKEEPVLPSDDQQTVEATMVQQQPPIQDQVKKPEKRMKFMEEIEHWANS